MDNIHTLTHAIERDVDLLLVEELKCSPDFVRWFANRVAEVAGAPINFATSKVTHSKRRTHNRREIDICLELKIPARLATILLIENKLDTSGNSNRPSPTVPKPHYLYRAKRRVPRIQFLYAQAPTLGST